MFYNLCDEASANRLIPPKKGMESEREILLFIIARALSLSFSYTHSLSLSLSAKKTQSLTAIETERSNQALH